MAGRASDRNPVSPEKNPPTDWQIQDAEQQARNIRWSTPVGTQANGGPIVANGLVWVGTNNEAPLDPAIVGDRGVLACFRESDGKFLYQYSSPRLTRGITDWPGFHGLSGSPVTEQDRLWFITNRREVVCLDTGPLSRGEGAPKELWKYDLVEREGVYPHSPQIHSHNTSGSLAIYNELLFVPTGNGVGVDHPNATKVRAPDAPSLVCLHKESGSVVWKDNSAGKEAYGGHYASPLVVDANGVVQVVHPQADGWVRSFEAMTGKLLWKFDINRKGAKWDWAADSRTSKRVVIATPVYAEDKIYFATGREVEFDHDRGHLFCIDPNKRGDISPELDDGHGKGIPNPNSGVIWDFVNNASDPSQSLGETASSVAVSQGLLVIPDRYGRTHCFDAKTGEHHWTYEPGREWNHSPGQFGDPLIVDDKIYFANEDGTVTILALSKSLKEIATHEMNWMIVAPPVFANGTLYILTKSTLYAIGAKH